MKEMVPNEVRTWLIIFLKYSQYQTIKQSWVELGLDISWIRQVEMEIFDI